MTRSFYRAFEDRHRGSRELIIERLKQYAPFLESIMAVISEPRALDLGCGRGEWLEYLGTLGIGARGVDLDRGMLAACKERGLAVRLQDGLHALQECADESLSLVTAFHVVEHIGFEELHRWTEEVLRVLQPGGLLIYETPNPENIVLGSSNFYLDPTHRRPLPPALLEFLVEYVGFARWRIARLQEDPKLQEEPSPSLLQVLSGISPDYAVIAQKKAPATVMSAFDEAFTQRWGLTLEELASRYDQSLISRLERAPRKSRVMKRDRPEDGD